MRVLIVEGKPDLGWIWSRHLKRCGFEVFVSSNQSDAIATLQNDNIDIIILNLVLENGSAFAVADFASYRQPKAKVIFVSDSGFFSDGSIFQHIPNACAMMPTEVSPEDLGALVEHYGANH